MEKSDRLVELLEILKRAECIFIEQSKSYIKRMRLTWKIFSAYSIEVVMIVKFRLKD